MNREKVKLTQFSHGAGCGCKLSPEALSEIVGTAAVLNTNLLVGNDTKDDAVVYNLNDGTALISTTDFFTPIVDDALDFGKIAAVNAVSDVYAMGGKPLVAIAILGWPIDKIPAEVAGLVLEGGRSACKEAGIQLAGGHSIDTPEPIFGLAVTGKVSIQHLKKNSTSTSGSTLYLTKPLGVGIYSTAQKRGLISTNDLDVAVRSMTKLNLEGEIFGQLDFVNAMTDVTGFGLLGHLIEMCEGSNVSAELNLKNIPILPNLEKFLKLNSIPGGTKRNWNSYRQKVGSMNENWISILSDPQTSGGLLVSVNKGSEGEFEKVCSELGLDLNPIGSMREFQEPVIMIEGA